MDKKTKELAEQAGFVLDELPDTVLQPLETFADLLRVANTREVIALCANTINNNLNEQQQKVKNRWEIVELVVIVLAFIAWTTWWYTQSH
jgi:ABC-type phosphate/phosphonate transport system permease subunit